MNTRSSLMADADTPVALQAHLCAKDTLLAPIDVAAQAIRTGSSSTTARKQCLTACGGHLLSTCS